MSCTDVLRNCADVSHSTEQPESDAQVQGKGLREVPLLTVPTETLSTLVLACAPACSRRRAENGTVQPAESSAPSRTQEALSPDCALSRHRDSQSH